MSYIFYSKIYDKNQFNVILAILNANSIPYKVDDHSNFENIRVPCSTYYEYDLLVKEEDFSRVDELLRSSDNE